MSIPTTLDDGIWFLPNGNEVDEALVGYAARHLVADISRCPIHIEECVDGGIIDSDDDESVVFVLVDKGHIIAQDISFFDDDYHYGILSYLFGFREGLRHAIRRHRVTTNQQE